MALATGYLHAYLAMYQRVPLALAGMGVGAVSPQTNAFLDGCRSGTIWACWFCGSLALLTMTFGLWHPEPGPWKNHHVAPQSTIASSAATMGEGMPAALTLVPHPKYLSEKDIEEAVGYKKDDWRCPCCGRNLDSRDD